MQKKKVLEIVEAFGGGVFTMINDLSNGLSDEYEIVIIYGKRKQTPENFKKLFNNSIKFIEIENFTRELNFKKDIKAFFELKKIIKSEKPEVIHLHSSKSGVLGRISTIGKKYKMLYNPHGFSFLKQDDSKFKRFIYRVIEKTMSILNPKCTIVGCSYGEYLEAKRISKNSVWINNGINVKKLNEETRTLKNEKLDLNNLKICTIGRIGYQKNPSLFNEIAELLPNIKFTWIGDGELKKELTSENITITGWKSRSEVLEELSKQNIFILTSLWEGLPITLLEAGFMEKLCIVSNVIGNRDVIITNQNGYVFNNHEDVVKIIKNINEKKYENLAKNLKEEIETQYDTKTMINKYKKIYRG